MESPKEVKKIPEGWEYSNPEESKITSPRVFARGSVGLRNIPMAKLSTPVINTDGPLPVRPIGSVGLRNPPTRPSPQGMKEDPVSIEEGTQQHVSVKKGDEAKPRRGEASPGSSAGSCAHPNIDDAKLRRGEANPGSSAGSYAHPNIDEQPKAMESTPTEEWWGERAEAA